MATPMVTSETGQSSTTEPVQTGVQPGGEQPSGVKAMEATPVKKTKSSTKKTPKKVVPMADHPLACEFGSLQVNGIRYSLGDVAMVRPVAEGAHRRYIAKVVGIDTDSDGCVVVKVQWYYRPEETKSGKGFHHGAAEVFSTNHFDQIPGHVIDGKGLVLSLDHYHEYMARLGEGVVPDADIDAEDVFFCRQHYALPARTLTPALDLYCHCRRPCNPDSVMIACDRCDEWLHTECMDLAPEVASQLSSFVCPRCKTQTPSQ